MRTRTHETQSGWPLGKWGVNQRVQRLLPHMLCLKEMGRALLDDKKIRIRRQNGRKDKVAHYFTVWS